jgi:hypothetical protein
MTTRIAKRRRSRDRRLKRRDLVHAAGCTDLHCVVRLAVFGGYEMVNEACAEGIRLPRSVARKWLGSGRAR